MRKLVSLFIVFFPFLLPAQDIRVMTYNIRFDNPGDGVNQWSSRKQKVFDLIRKYDPDIIGVQEALHHQLEDIANALPAYAFVGVGRDDGQKKGEYSAILYKKDGFDIEEKNTFWLSETPEVPGSKSWDAAITRVASWAILKHRESGKAFFMVNTHFDHIGKEARANSAALLASRIESLRRDLPVVLTGDLNCTRGDKPYHVMLSSNSRLGLVDPAPDDPPGTFCNFGVGSMPCKPIDYILVSGAVKSSDYVVITDNDGQNYPSDHLPVMVRLVIP